MTYPATLKVWKVLSQPRSAWPRSLLRRGITFIVVDGKGQALWRRGANCVEPKDAGLEEFREYVERCRAEVKKW